MSGIFLRKSQSKMQSNFYVIPSTSTPTSTQGLTNNPYKFEIIHKILKEITCWLSLPMLYHMINISIFLRRKVNRQNGQL